MSGEASRMSLPADGRGGRGESMLTHGQIWAAIDAIAARYGMTASGLAKRAGLDPTTFNKSKRVSADGRLRWPSTESVSKVLDATGATIDEFMALVGAHGPQASSRTLPLLSETNARRDGLFTAEGQPTGAEWDEVNFPDLPPQGNYAIELDGDATAPLYRRGDILVCARNTPLRRGDRVVVRTKTGEVVVRELKRRTARTVELAPLVPQHPDIVLPGDSIDWIARVMWASQ